MASFENYLSNALTRYNHQDSVRRELKNIFQTYKDLNPTLEPFIFNDGTRKELLNLVGTIPVSYKGITYNIPVIIWLIDTHPYNPPMCFVKPTSDMQIRPGKHVDANGRITLPYLREWKHTSSDLIGLIQVMIIVFGEDPPVYSTPNPKPYPMASSTGNFGNLLPASSMPYPPQYPPTTSQAPYPTVPKTTYGGYPNASYPSSYTTGYPPYPGMSQQSNYPPYPQATSYSGSNLPYPLYSEIGAMPVPPQSPPTSQSTPGNTSTITEHHIRASVLSAVEEKVKRKMWEVVQQSQAEVDTLKRTQEDLKQGRAKLDHILSSLDKEMSDLEKNILILQDKKIEVQEINEKLSNQESYDIDEAVVTTAPLYKQLLNSFAEENATEDAIYYLGEALRKGVIDLDVFLKHVRSLSRKQFMLRALMQKCRQKAGLAC